jgi:multidrug resistance efflux pump
MKNKFLTLLASPKVAITAVFVVAVVIGATSYVMHKNTLNEQFAEINTTASSTIIADVSNGSSHDLTLAFPVGGRIKSVSVKIGDTVQAGTLLASLDAESAIGAMNQAQAAYVVAQTAYDKLVNGASTQDVAVSQAAVNSASVALDNAKQNMLRDMGSAYNTVNATVLSNTNNLFSNPQSNSAEFAIMGTVQTNGQAVSNINTERTDVNNALLTWQSDVGTMDTSTIDQNFKNSSDHIILIKNYLTDLLNILTSYTQVTAGGSQTTVATDESAVVGAKASVDSVNITLTNDMQAITSAQASLDQAKASLTLKQSPARPEDIATAKAQVQSTQGALQIAQSVYNNNVIVAPVSGKIINVSITAGQIATANTPAIELLAQ